MTQQTGHESASWFYEAGGEYCPHGPEPDRDSDAWNDWAERHTGSPQDVFVCLDAPAGDACAACSEESGEFVPWTACNTRPRRKDNPMPEQTITHQPETVLGGALECVERECEDFFTDDGDEIPGKETCSHIHEMEICTGCTAENGTDDFPPVVAWTDCPHRTPAAVVAGGEDTRSSQ